MGLINPIPLFILHIYKRIRKVDPPTVELLLEFPQ